MTEITLLAGVERPDAPPLPAFSDDAVEFLDALSGALRVSELRTEPETAAFAFWCRRAHLLQFRRRYADGAARVGRGRVFHIAPSNVPLMFAYSYAVGLLAGNANAVRVSERAAPIAAAVCGVMRRVLEDFPRIKAMTSIVSCPRDDEVTGDYLASCDAAVVWGGDRTVRAMRTFPMRPGALFIAFPDRWSMALLSEKALAEMDGAAFQNIVHRFYNDTYAMDQNACSSPRLVLWLRDGGDAAVRERFWAALAAEAEHMEYPRDAFRAARKYERACLAGLTEPGVRTIRRCGGNLLYVLTLAGPPADSDALTGGFGLFYEAETETPEGVLPYVTEKLQTVVCAGIDRTALASILAERGAIGADRIVEVGQALAFDPVWDGKDLIRMLSREICIP